MGDNWLDSVKKHYSEVLQKIQTTPPRWDRYDALHHFGLSGSDWRFWDSIETLDITLAHIRNLKQLAGKRRRPELKQKLETIYKLVDNALSLIDPWSWNGGRKRLMNFTSDTTNLKAALNLLSQAKDLFAEDYLCFSVLEARKSGAWLVTTPLVVEHLHDACYGLQKILSI